MTETTTSPDAAGSTTLVDTTNTNDSGSDHYLAMAAGTASRALDGTVTTTVMHADTDGGNEDDNVSDFGTVDSVEAAAGGGVVRAHDDFKDSNDDVTDYDDSDMEMPAGGGGGEADQFNEDDDALDTFGSDDKIRVVQVSTAAAGAVTTTTFTDHITDNGFDKSHDNEGDIETLPTPGSGESDSFTFDTSSGEQDTTINDGTTVVTTIGYVTPNDYVDSTETLTDNETDNSSDNTDDPGTETDNPTGDGEQDDFTDKSDVGSQVQLGDILDSTETAVAADGTITTTGIHNNGSDNTITDENDQDGDLHSVTPGTPGNPATQTPGTAAINGDISSFLDKYGLTDISNGNSTVTTNVWKPVAGGFLSTFTSLIGSGNDTYTDNGGDNGGSNITGPLNGTPASDTEWDTSFDDVTDNSGGKSLENDYSKMIVTDPTTGVVTKLGTNNSFQDKFSSFMGQHVGEITLSNTTSPPSQGGSTGGSSGSDDVNENDNSFASDKSNSSSSFNVSIIGSPVAGETENINQTISFTGNDQSFGNSTGGGDDDMSGSSGTGAGAQPTYTEDVNGNETVTGFDFGNQTVSTLGNSTISMTDPTTSITTSDTVFDNGSLGVGYNGNGTITDKLLDDTANNTPESDEEDVTDDDLMKQVITGGDKSTETIGINGTTPDGSTIHSTETLGDKSYINGNTTDGDTGGETIIGASSNQPGSDVASNTEKSGDDIKTGDLETDNLNTTLSYIDPTSGLSVSVNVTDNSSDQENDEEIDGSKDVEGVSMTGGSAPTDDYTFDNKLIESGKATDTPTIIINTQGTDTAGEQVNVQETLGVIGNATTSLNDEDIGEYDSGIVGAPPSGDTETVHADVQSHATLIDTIIGSVATLDPTTGIKTTKSDNLSITGDDDEHDHEDETDVHSAGNPDQDTPVQIDSGSLTTNTNAGETVTETNPDGSVIGTPVTTTDTGANAVSFLNTLGLSGNGTVTNTPTATETGSDTSSDPTVGVTSWSNRSLDAATASQTFASQTLASNLTLDGATTTKGSNGNGGSNPNGQNSGNSGSGSNSGTITSGGQQLTISGPGVTSPRTTGLIVAGLDRAKVTEFMNMLQLANTVQNRIDELNDDLAVVEAEKAKALAEARTAWVAGTGSTRPADVEALFNGRIQDLQSKLTTETANLSKIEQTYNYAFGDELVVGFPRGLTAEAQRGQGIGGVGFDAALIAYRVSLTRMDPQGLESAEGPLEFVLMAAGPGLLAKAAKAAGGVGAALATAKATFGTVTAALKALGTKAAMGGNFSEIMARMATRNATSGKLVLGKGFSPHHPGAIYTQVAEHYNATYFKLANWRALTKTLSRADLWEINKAFLKQQIDAGKQIILSHDPAKATGFFLKEVEFLEDLGYQFVQDGWVWKAVK